MEILEWYREYSWIGQLLLFAIFIYTYFRNKNKPVDPITQEKALWYRTAGMTMGILAIVSACITGILFYDDASSRDRAFGLMTNIFLTLFTIACLYIEYRFRRKKKLNDNQFETKEKVM